MVTEVMAVREHLFIGDDNKEVKGMFIYLKITQSEGRVDTRSVL